MFSSRRGLPSGRGGLNALAWPLTLLILAMASFRGEDATNSLLGGLLLLVAAPTTWLVELLGASPGVSVGVGIATSLPMWFAMGSRLAARSSEWGEWWRRYALAAFGWMVGVVTLMAIAAAF